MPNSITVQDTALDEIEVGQKSGYVTLDCETDFFEFAASEAVSLADAIYEKAGVEKPDGRTYAGDISLNEALLRVAAIHGVEAEFRYAKGESGSVIETRRLVPSELRASRDGKLSFVGQDPDRDDRGGIRQFRLDRIKGLVTIHA